MPQRMLLRDDEKKPLNVVVRLAIADQLHYLSAGNFEADYGADWPRAARELAEYFEGVAAFMQRMQDNAGFDTGTACLRLALDYRKSAADYEETTK